MSRTRHLAAVVLVGLLTGATWSLTGCGGPGEPPGEGGVAGSLVGKDDTGLPDSKGSDGSASVLVVPGASGPEVFPDTELVSTDEDLRYLTTDIDLDRLERDLGGLVFPIDEDGLFRLHAPAGPSVVCLIRRTPTGAHVTSGCRYLDLPSTGRMSASWGEGGFGVELQPGS